MDLIPPFSDRPVELPEKDRCNGVCMSAADIGLPEYGGMAYPDPECPEHGVREPERRDTKYDAYPVDDPEDV